MKLKLAHKKFPFYEHITISKVIKCSYILLIFKNFDYFLKKIIAPGEMIIYN